MFKLNVDNYSEIFIFCSFYFIYNLFIHAYPISIDKSLLLQIMS